MSLYLTPEVLVSAYTQGYFPMADPSDGEIYWHTPDPRAIFPLETLKTPRSIRQAVRKEGFEFRYDKDFEQVIQLCSQREDTWIDDEIVFAYTSLYDLGLAHSVETYKNDKLVGGLYGVSIGAAFFGESMFSLISNASKAAFFELVGHLRKKGFILLDSQYLNDHTALLGAKEVEYKEYIGLLHKAIEMNVRF